MFFSKHRPHSTDKNDKGVRRLLSKRIEKYLISGVIGFHLYDLLFDTCRALVYMTDMGVR